MKIVVEYPRPNKKLSPNARLCWRGAMKVKKDTRLDAYIRTRNAIANTEGGEDFKPTGYKLIWYFKGTPADADNCLANCKAVIDGAASAFGINDRFLEVKGIARIRAASNEKRIKLIFDDEPEDLTLEAE